MWLHNGSFCLHQLPCCHLGNVNHAPFLVTGFAELEFLALGDDLHVPFYREDSFAFIGGDVVFAEFFIFIFFWGVPPVPGFSGCLSSVLINRIWGQVAMFLAAVWCHFLRNSLCPSKLSSEVYFG